MVRNSAHTRPLSTLCAVTLCLMILRAGQAACAATMTGGLLWSQTYESDAWQPLQFELQNETERAIAGYVALPLKHPAMSAVMRAPVHVPPKSRVRTIVWGYFASTDS